MKKPECWDKKYWYEKTVCFPIIFEGPAGGRDAVKKPECWDKKYWCEKTVKVFAVEHWKEDVKRWEKGGGRRKVV